MSALLADTETINELVELLASIPNGTNPFDFLQEELWTGLVPPVPESFQYQLFVLSGVSGMSVINSR